MHRVACVLTGLVVLAAGMALAAAPDDAVQEIAKGFVTKALELDGKEIEYVVYIPAEYDPKKPMPAIIFLNGMGECGTDGLRQIAVGLGPAVMLNAQKWPFIVLFPQKQVTEAEWEDEDAMVMAVLEKSKREYSIDQSRLYLTGLSQGGHGTWAIAAEHPDLFAAIAPICGWGSEDMAKKLAKVPAWIFHGEDDPVVQVDAAKKMAERLKAAGGSVKLTIYPGVGHNSWDKAYREEKLHEWFLSHRKQQD